MTSRKITRCRGARGQLVLYNPLTVPSEGADGVLTVSEVSGTLLTWCDGV
ncbi:hypothetical protein PR003_g22164 [Phytophthora rubi]|uniref:Uncharacterized protein n=1 Tax=Phytophthora rubi TaxID=129364 RepID=A0A6A4D681_9STRA|nr:hypothetical protein PR003_g22164 [Phytophthora rubi]